MIVPRQNGKGAIIEARELAGLFLFGEQLVIHSAHEFKTSKEAFRRIRTLIESTPDFDKRVQQFRFSSEEVSIELLNGQRLRFVARSTGSGRGFTGDTVILDEAYKLSATAMSALLPTMSARPNPQLWYLSSAPLPMIESDILRRLCKRGRSGAEGKPVQRFAYFEWSADPLAELDSRSEWATANPGLGYRISTDAIATERAAMDDVDFARERLGIFPDLVESSEPPAVEAEQWKRCEWPSSRPVDPVTFAFEVSMDRRWSVIAAAAPSTEGGTHVEVIDNRRGTAWVVERLVELRDRHNPRAIVCSPSSPAGALLADCARAGLEIGVPEDGKVRNLTTAEYAQACGAAHDAIADRRWRHLGQGELNKAVGGATKRNTGDVWVFDRRQNVDISPFVAVTLAAWVANLPDPKPAPEPFLVVT